MNLKYLYTICSLALCINALASVSIKSCNGWLESAYIEWDNDSQYSDYHVYYKSEGQTYLQIDDELVRNYGSYGRADMLGLSEGSYQIKVIPVKDGNEVNSDATESSPVNVKAHDRSGFGFTGSQTPGAYDSKGKLKADAIVLYVTEANKDLIQMDVITNGKGGTTSCKGIVEILTAYKKGYETHPLDIRIIGKVTNSGAIAENADFKGDLVIDLGNCKTSPVTIEGVGFDATAYGWGIRIKNAYYCEVRNLGFFYCNSDEGDNVGLQQSNYYIWVHHNDMFYGKEGGDADQKKGDGALDCKKSSYITFSYNHFWDNGKCNLLGLSEGVFSYDPDNNYFITYHHNWYDHSDSRHPRCRYYNAHVYNNYYDGNSKYGVGATQGASVFVQNNYFRNCKYPMLTSMQGTDLYNASNKRSTDNATFSKEDGGYIKAYGNIMTGSYTFIPYNATEVYTSGKPEAASVRGINTKEDFDAYVVNDPSTQVPNTIKSYQGSHYYSNFDTKTMYTAKVDDASKVVEIVTGELGAGRMQHGDFSWSFSSSDDSDHDVNKALQTAIINYQSKLVDLYTIPSDNGSSPSQPEDNPGGNGNADDDPVIPDESSLICHFMGKTPSNTTFYNFSSCSYSDSKGSANFGGKTYTDCLKMETSTVVSFSTTRVATLTIVFANGETPSVKLNGTSASSISSASVNDNILTIKNLEAGNWSLSKGNTANIFFIGISYDGESTDLDIIKSVKDINGPIYNLRGQIIRKEEMKPNTIYINNGRKKVIVR